MKAAHNEKALKTLALDLKRKGKAAMDQEKFVEAITLGEDVINSKLGTPPPWSTADLDKLSKTQLCALIARTTHVLPSISSLSKSDLVLKAQEVGHPLEVESTTAA